MAAVIAEFTVVGTPVPQGSMRSFERAGRTFTKSSNAGPLEKWRGDVRSAFTLLWHGRDLFTPKPVAGAISMRLAFRIARPKSHFLPANAKRSAPVLRTDAPTWCIGKPDGDKLERAVLDALTGLLYVDDAQVVVVGKTKTYANPGEQPGVDIRVSAL